MKYHIAAYKSAIREQKLALEISAAKRERDFYLSKVDKARALSSIEERLKKVLILQASIFHALMCLITVYTLDSKSGFFLIKNYALSCL